MCIFASFIWAYCPVCKDLHSVSAWFPFWSTILYSELNEKFSHDDERSRAAPAFSVITIQDFIVTIIIIFLGNVAPSKTFVSSSSSRERHRSAWVTATRLRWLTCVYLFPPRPRVARRLHPEVARFSTRELFQQVLPFHEQIYIINVPIINDSSAEWVTESSESHFLIALNQRFSAFCPFSPSFEMFFRGRVGWGGSQQNS